MKKRIITKCAAIGCVSLAVCMLACSCSFFGGKKKKSSGEDVKADVGAAYSLVYVKRNDIKPVLTGVCTVTSFGAVKYSYDIGGYPLERYPVKEGEEVTVGTVLASINVDGAQERIQEIDEVLARGGINSRRREQYEAEKASLQNLIENKDIKATIDGVVKYTNRSYTTSVNGKNVIAGDILVIVEPKTLALAQGVMTRETAEVSRYTIGINSKVTLRPDTGKNREEFTGTIIGTSGGSDSTTVFFIDLSEAPESIKVGDRLSVTFEEDEAKQALKALKVPKDVVEVYGGRTFVYVLDSQGLRRERYVELGISDENYYEIKSGLEEGEAIIQFKNN